MENIFEKEYASLNTAQKQAVDTTEGPVMVIAGPGTGKTQILAIRIGKILLETDTRPENILCMTYTDSGAIAMRKRLIKMIGPDAYKVNIHTYHSFCNQVIQDNLSHFDKNSMDPISELESIALVRELIDQFKKGNDTVNFEARQFIRFIKLGAAQKGIELSEQDADKIELLVLSTMEKFNSKKPKQINIAVNKFNAMNHR